MADRILLKMNQPTQLVCLCVLGFFVMVSHSWMYALDCMTKTSIPRMESTEQIIGKMKKILKLSATISLSLPNRLFAKMYLFYPHVCEYVCMCVCLCVCLCVYVFVCVSVCSISPLYIISYPSTTRTCSQHLKTPRRVLKVQRCPSMKSTRHKLRFTEVTAFHLKASVHITGCA